MSILKTTHAGSKAIQITGEQTIIDEIAKLGYTYNYALRCWVCFIPNLPCLVIHENSFSRQSCEFAIYVYKEISKPITISYTIITMSDLFNFIKDLKLICQS